MFTTKLLQSTANFFNSESAATSINFDSATGLKDAFRIDNGTIAIRALNNDFVIFDSNTLEIVSKKENAMSQENWQEQVNEIVDDNELVENWQDKFDELFNDGKSPQEAVDWIFDLVF